MKTARWMLLAGLLACAGYAGDNLCENGSFDDPSDPLKAWTADYGWTGNTFYEDNYRRVSVVPQEGVKRNVLLVDGRGTKDAGTKVESRPIPFDPGGRYRCTVQFKGGPARMYFAGYAWKPGVRPTEKPEPGQLRPVYKSKAEIQHSRSWRTVSFGFPLKDLSDLGRRHLERVRFITVYIWSNGETYVDDVEVERLN
ncbi:MAG: hypothetical protein JW951_04960 [Lentisphaerae bacterium]|nr:hypothetical protein [Lentisphaerota bacterium]